MPEDALAATRESGGPPQTLGSSPQDITMAFARWVSETPASRIDPVARRWAAQALLDWGAVAVAGAHEPLAEMLIEELAAPQGAPADTAPCRLFGTGRRASLGDAALINGAFGHALDYDDVNRRMHGHPTAAIAPAVVALAEARGASSEATLAAFAVGYEIAAALGDMMGDEHYNHGFHATATVGAVGAAAGCAHLLGLDATSSAHALTLAGTQAAGLKAMFGSMAKPLHAGKASANGLLAARLAARGFTARENGLECPQGFGPTLSEAFEAKPFRPDPDQPLEVTRNLFKYHAACYLTHSAIEAIRGLKAEHGLSPDSVEQLMLRIPAASFRVCDIREPSAALDVKFSIRHLAALALSGADTADLALYSDATAQNPEVTALRRRVVEAEPLGETAARHSAEVEIRTTDGRVLTNMENVGVPAEDLDAQERKLVAKARSVATPALGAARVEAMIESALALANGGREQNGAFTRWTEAMA